MTLCALPASPAAPVTPIVDAAKLLIKCTRLPAEAAGVDCADKVRFVHVEIVNGTVISFSRCGPSDTVVTLGCFMTLTRVRQ